jgi:hypothetical protein
MLELQRLIGAGGKKIVQQSRGVPQKKKSLSVMTGFSYVYGIQVSAR